MKLFSSILKKFVAASGGPMCRKSIRRFGRHEHSFHAPIAIGGSLVIRLFLLLVIFVFVTTISVGSEQEAATQINTEQVKPEQKEAATHHLLRYKFKEGDVMKWRVMQSLKITTSIRGRSDFVETKSLSTKIWTVKNVDGEGNTMFEYQVEDVDMRQFQSGHDILYYDSRRDKDIPHEFISLEGTIGVPLAHLTMNSQGEMTKKIALTAYSGAAEENRIAISMPKEPVAVGDIWYVDVSTEIDQNDGTVKKITAREKYQLEQVRSSIAKISFVTQILTPLTPPEQSQIMGKFTSGVLEFDIKAGHLVSQTTNIDKRVVGLQGTSDNIHHLARFTECACDLKSCDICSTPQHPALNQ
ncbi:MAG: hypothetical protein ACRCUY_00520 [Thermoguttaceae bacterium]